MILAVLLAAATLESFAPGDVWGGRVRHPAVVNPPVRVESSDVLSLRGEWDFVTREHDNSAASLLAWWKYDYEPQRKYRKIRVPGNWESQGVGKPGRGTHHLGSDNAPKDLRHVYTGQGLYHKSVKIPASWAGKRVWLKIGGVNCRGYFNVNGKSIAMLTAHAGAWKYEITDVVKPGEAAEILATVDNAVGSRNAQPNNAHRWGGLTRDIELEATPATCIDDAWVRGDFDRRVAEVHVSVDAASSPRQKIGAENRCAADGSNSGLILRATIDGEKIEKFLSPPPPHLSTSSLHLEVPLRNFRAWSPDDPNLYTAKVEIVAADGKVLQTRFERFGVRKFEVRGKEFFLNDRPFYIRGFGDDSSYPITGSSPCDRAFHRDHLARAKAAGFNFIRLHTHCEMPEYLDVCDELGILVQLELSYYFDLPMDHFDYDPKRDIDERFVTYRRHPSWCVSSGGNEGKVGPAAGGLCYEYMKRIDPDRLVQEEDGPSSPDPNGLPIEDFCTGPMKTWRRGAFDPPLPFICHEYLNLSVKQDSRLEPQFTGVWKPLETRERRAERLSAVRLTHRWGDRLQDAQHALQKIFQKDGIERARIDPICDGYCYWTIADVGVENRELGVFSAQGLFDVFWNPKRCGSTPATFAVFNSPSCVLCDFCEETFPTDPATNFTWAFSRKWTSIPDTNRVLVAGMTIRPKVKFAHFGDGPVADAVLDWNLTAADGRVLVRGTQNLPEQACGGVRDLATLALTVPTVAAPCVAQLSAAVTGRVAGRDVRFANDWELYLFPARQPMDGSQIACADEFYERLAPRYPGLKRLKDAADRPVVICAANSPDETSAIKKGRRVVTLAGQTGEANFKLGWWWLGNQVGTAIEPHPVLGDFPTKEFLSPLYFRIIKTGTELPVCDVKEEDLVIAGEGGKSFFLYLSVSDTDFGGRHIRISGLDVLSATPEGTSLLDNVLRYAQSASGGRGATALPKPTILRTTQKGTTK